MTDKRIAKLVTILAEAFRAQASPVMFDAYALGLRGIPFEMIETATQKALEECKSMPTVAQLRELAGVLRPDDRAILAWQAVLCTQLNPWRWMDFADDRLINATIRNLGGWPSFVDRLSSAEAEKWLRLEFLKTYAALLRSGVTGDVCRPLQGLSQPGRLANGDMWQPVIHQIVTGLPALPKQSNHTSPSLRASGVPIPKLKGISDETPPSEHSAMEGRSARSV